MHLESNSLVEWKRTISDCFECTRKPHNYVRCKSVAAVVEKGCAVKSLHGRGRKRFDLVECLYQMPIFEIDRLISSDVQLNCAMVRNVTLTL